MDKLLRILITMGVLERIESSHSRNRFKIRRDIWERMWDEDEDSSDRPRENERVGLIDRLHPL